MITIKSEKEIEVLREGGKILAQIMNILLEDVVEGASSFEINKKCGELMKEYGGKPSFLNYTPYGANRPYPGNLCISVNNEIVHGIPNEEEKIFKYGDLVTLDAGLIYKDLFTDHAVTKIIGQVPKRTKELVERTKEALNAAIKQCKVGNTVGDIGNVIENIACDAELSVVEGLSGHGVGYGVHEDPYIPNYGDKGEGEKLLEGMVIAIEPMFSLGSGDIKTERNGYTYSTKDGSLSAQFEHTVAITKKGPIVLTKI
jgi:methionyl aminopeptidase